MARTSQAVSTGSLGAKSGTTGAMRLSHELEGWLRGDGDKTLGGLIDLFEERSFAILFLFLLGPFGSPLAHRATPTIATAGAAAGRSVRARSGGNTVSQTAEAGSIRSSKPHL